MFVGDESQGTGAAGLRSLHVITSDARRGAETYAIQLAAELGRRGHDARTLALVGTGQPSAHDVPVIGVSRRSPRALQAVRAAAADVDVVVAHGSSTLEACAAALIGASTPFVYRTIGDPGFWVTTPLRRRVVGTLLRRAVRHVALWDGAKEQLRRMYRLPGDRIDVIPNAVPADGVHVATVAERLRARKRFDVSPGAVCLGYVGALSPEKSVRTAIDACASIAGSSMLVAGDGPEARTLRDHARRVAGDRVRFLGQLTDPADVYLASDLLLLPSRSEGMPAVIIEAGLRGRATVATEVGSLPSMIDGGRTGFLVPPADRHRFAISVREALRTAGEVGERAAVSFRRRFTMEQTADLWTTALVRAADQRPQR